jgi:hypothetical protein
MLSSMLHALAVGNMLPASVRTVCFNIEPAVVTKPADRGRDREPREADGAKRVFMVTFDEGGRGISRDSSVWRPRVDIRHVQRLWY